MTNIDFSSGQLREVAEQLMAQESVLIRSRNLQPLVSLMLEHALLVGHAPHRYGLTDAGRRYLTRALTLGELRQAPTDPEQWLHEQGLPLPTPVNLRLLAALYRRHGGNGRPLFSPDEEVRFAEQGVELCRDRLLRLRTSLPLSLFFQGGRLVDGAPLLEALGEISLPERALPGLGKIISNGEPLTRLITTDRTGVFTALPLPPDTLLAWLPPGGHELIAPLFAALPATVSWSHLTDLEPAGLERTRTLAERIGRPLSCWLPTDLSPHLRHYARPLEHATWEPSRLPRPLLARLTPLIEQGLGLPAELLALAHHWDAVG
ncbi:hypothetical protein [Aeromonas simiae]|uniref:hypothetical protein n=1 Tax=Aeromonas simiae TaxID=218936 RepID=UPI0005AB3364|nr:hypothetical protein [Aeromonas simiae]MDO2947217.1 hypothetical protein [Aeromonas simiae]MDO2954828.1 hypothetical protein [Aeromonas simiae]